MPIKTASRPSGPWKGDRVGCGQSANQQQTQRVDVVVQNRALINVHGICVELSLEAMRSERTDGDTQGQHHSAPKDVVHAFSLAGSEERSYLRGKNPARLRESSHLLDFQSELGGIGVSCVSHQAAGNRNSRLCAMPSFCTLYRVDRRSLAFFAMVCAAARVDFDYSRKLIFAEPGHQAVLAHDAVESLHHRPQRPIGQVFAAPGFPSASDWSPA